MRQGVLELICLLRVAETHRLRISANLRSLTRDTPLLLNSWLPKFGTCRLAAPATERGANFTSKAGGRPLPIHTLELPHRFIESPPRATDKYVASRLSRRDQVVTSLLFASDPVLSAR